MHHALLIEEILLNIFGQCHSAELSWTVQRSHSTADLAALARTCRTFKEPALDVLWSELIDLCPLAFCLPECRRSPGRCYSFASPRNDAEWDTLRSYTRRVRRIISFSSPNGHLDPHCISATFDSHLLDPLFPNLRFLRWQGGMSTLPIMHFAVYPLACLDIRSPPGEDVSVYTHLLDILVPQCPNMRRVRIQVTNDVQFGEIVYRHLLSWNRLQVVDCLDVAMPIDVIPHLSSISTLFWLSFTLNAQSTDLFCSSSSPLVFAQLVYLEIISESLESVTGLMTHIHFPAVQVFIVPFPRRPSKAAVKSHLSTLGDTCSPNTLTDLRLLNLRSFAPPASSLANVDHTTSSQHDHRLCIDDVRPCMAFGNLCALHINLEWSIDLTDADMLTLVSAWPAIEHLVINDRWGWRTTTPHGGGSGGWGITLDGLAQIVQRCRCLWELCVAIDAESATDVTLPLDIVDVSARKQPFRLNVADSPIRRASVSALRTALSAFGFSRDTDRFSAWDGSEMGDIPGAEDFRYLWRSVFF